MKWFVVLVAVWATCWAMASESTHKGGRTMSPPKIDGVVETNEWVDAIVGTGAVDRHARPMENAAKFFLAYDEKYVYFAVQVGDSDPKKIAANEYRPNLGVGSDDNAQLLLDVSGQNREFHEFYINASSGSASFIPGGRATKAEWRGDMESRGRITETGWEAEARIPWAIMRLPAAGPRDMRFNLVYQIPRMSLYYAYTDIFSNKTENNPTWQGVEVPKVEDRKSIKLLPYVYAGTGDKEKLLLNSGLDYKMNISRGLELAGTINPDFRNIENEILSLDFSYFERVGGETRPFFQEGVNYFNPSRTIFRSQRLTNFDSGLKIYGKPSDNSRLGILMANDFGKETATVLNYGVSPTEKSSYAIGLADYRKKGIAGTSVETSFDTTLGRHNYSGRFAAAFDEDRKNGAQFSVAYNYNEPGISAWTSFFQRDANFNPRLGFAFERDLRGLEGGGNVYREFAKGKLASTGYGANVWEFWRLDGRQYKKGVSTWYNVSLRNNFSGGFNADLSRFEKFDDQTIGGYINFPWSDPYRLLSYYYNVGHQSGLPYQSQGFSWASKPFRRIRTSLNSQFYEIGGFRSTQLIGTALWEIDNDRSLSAKVVRQNRDYNFYVSYRKAGGRGADYYLIVGDPNARSFTPRVILKAVFPLEIVLK